MLHYATLRYTTLHYATLHYATLRYTTLHHATPHHTTHPPCIAVYEVDFLCAYKVGFRSPVYTPTMGEMGEKAWKSRVLRRSMPLDLEDDFIQRWLSSLYPAGFPQGNDSVYAALQGMAITCHTIHFRETCLPNDVEPIFFCWGFL